MGNANYGTPLNITVFDFCLDDVKGKFLSSLRRQGFSTPKCTAPTLGISISSTSKRRHSCNNDANFDVNIQTLKTSGTEKFNPLWMSYTHKSNAIVIFLHSRSEHEKLRQRKYFKSSFDDFIGPKSDNTNLAWWRSGNLLDWIWNLVEGFVYDPNRLSAQWEAIWKQCMESKYAFLFGIAFHEKKRSTTANVTPSSKMYLLGDFHIQRLILSFVGQPDPIGTPVLLFVHNPVIDGARVVGDNKDEDEDERIDHDLLRTNVDQVALLKRRGIPLFIQDWNHSCNEQGAFEDGLQKLVSYHQKLQKRIR